MQQVNDHLIKSTAKGIYFKYTKQKITDDNLCLMTLEQFQQFLKNEQKEELDYDETLQLILQIKLADAQPNVSSRLSYLNFSEYLFSSYNLLNSYPQSEDLSFPLTQYYIHSAYKVFNANVSRDQFKIINNLNEPIRDLDNLLNLLAIGVKHIELEIWEDANNIPIIQTGTLQDEPILLSKVLEIMVKHLFITSPMPLILYFEDHCTKIGKQNIKNIVNEILGEYLLQDSDIYIDKMPSPKGLEFKIILSGYTRIKQLKLKIDKNLQQQQQQQQEEYESQIQLQNEQSRRNNNLKNLKLNNKLNEISVVGDEQIDIKNKHVDYLLEGTLILQNRSEKNFLLHKLNDDSCKLRNEMSEVNSYGFRRSASMISNFQCDQSQQQSQFTYHSSSFSQYTQRLQSIDQNQAPKILAIQELQQQFTLYQVDLNSMDRIKDYKMIYETNDSPYCQLLQIKQWIQSNENSITNQIMDESNNSMIRKDSKINMNQEFLLEKINYVHRLSNQYLIKQYPNNKIQSTHNISTQV